MRTRFYDEAIPFKMLLEAVHQLMLTLKRVHTRVDVSTVVNEDEQGIVAEFLPAFLPLLG